MLKDLTSCGLGGAERPYKLWTGTEVLKDLTSCGLGGAERPYKLWTGTEVLKDLTSCGMGGAERPYKLWNGRCRKTLQAVEWEVLKDLTSSGLGQTTTISTDRLKELEVKRGCIPQRSGPICGQPD